MKKLILFAGCALASHAYADSREFKSQGLSRVVIENHIGDIKINTVDSPKSTVTITKNTSPEACKVNAERSGDKLDVKVKRQGSTNCVVDLEVQVPKMVNLDIKNGNGNVHTKGTEGKLDFKVGNGSLVADGKFNEIDGKAGSGNIEIKGATGSSQVGTGSGNISVTYLSLPEKGQAELKNGSGNSTLLLPKGSKFRADIMAMAGKMENEFGTDTKSKFSVKAMSGSGDLQVKSY
ncbi:hypothetical protein [Bdellovibrio sp. GT3]|uniref:hypothetical protein n=1 Tax=unclassified Bdellovibrio TaxID=2633795 RepID=UPI0030F017AD